LGTRREIKNLNSFKFMQQAIDYEVRWQIEQLEDGHAIEQATVLFNPDTGETRAMRTKEDAADYRYFPDPDLPPLCISQEWRDRIRSEMPKLPREIAQHFRDTYGLGEYDATLLTQSQALATYFESAAKTSGQPKLAANWVLGEVSAFINKQGLSIDDVTVPNAVAVGHLIKRIAAGEINGGGAKTVFQQLCTTQEQGIQDLAAYIDQIIDAQDLRQVNDTSALEAIVDTVIAANAKNVAEFQAGNDKALNALVGQAMKASKGKANPQQINDLLRSKLAR
jgi:aspartyl-tRNA(Asn)/glutamyl-tRNA(Gln) amidotransferase subunit B